MWWILGIAAVWLAIAIPVAVLIGKMIKKADENV